MREQDQFCELCQRAFTSHWAYAVHMDGLAHRELMHRASGLSMTCSTQQRLTSGVKDAELHMLYDVLERSDNKLNVVRDKQRQHIWDADVSCSRDESRSYTAGFNVIPSMETNACGPIQSPTVSQGHSPMMIHTQEDSGSQDHAPKEPVPQSSASIHSLSKGALLQDPAPKDYVIKDSTPQGTASKDPAAKDLLQQSHVQRASGFKGLTKSSPLIQNPAQKGSALKDPLPKELALKGSLLQHGAVKSSGLLGPALKDIVLESGASTAGAIGNCLNIHLSTDGNNNTCEEDRQGLSLSRTVISDKLAPKHVDTHISTDTHTYTHTHTQIHTQSAIDSSSVTSPVQNKNKMSQSALLCTRQNTNKERQCDILLVQSTNKWSKRGKLNAQYTNNHSQTEKSNVQNSNNQSRLSTVKDQSTNSKNQLDKLKAQNTDKQNWLDKLMIQSTNQRNQRDKLMIQSMNIQNQLDNVMIQSMKKQNKHDKLMIQSMNKQNQHEKLKVQSINNRSHLDKLKVHSPDHAPEREKDTRRNRRHGGVGRRGAVYSHTHGHRQRPSGRWTDRYKTVLDGMWPMRHVRGASSATAAPIGQCPISICGGGLISGTRKRKIGDVPSLFDIKISYLTASDERQQQPFMSQLEANNNPLLLQAESHLKFLQELQNLASILLDDSYMGSGHSYPWLEELPTRRVALIRELSSCSGVTDVHRIRYIEQKLEECDVGYQLSVLTTLPSAQLQLIINSLPMPRAFNHLCCDWSFYRERLNASMVSIVKACINCEYMYH